MVCKGILVLVVISFWLFCPGCQQRPPEHNVMVITLDTTRADYVDVGSGAKAFTPEISQFAQQGVTFLQAYSTIPQTLPAHLGMFTAHFPHELGVLENADTYDGRFTTLAQTLKKKGYYTVGLVSLGTLASNTGIARGFDRFEESPKSGATFFLPAATITEKAIAILPTLKQKKFFMFLHYSDPHTPYSPPGVFAPFRIYLDGQLLEEFNAYQGAILRKKIALTRGKHCLEFKVDTNRTDFDQFALRRLKTIKKSVLTFDNISFSEDHYGGAYLIKGTQGKIQVTCTGEDTLSFFQVIPMLTRTGALEMYRKEIEYMDIHIGKLLAELKRANLWERTVIVMLGDHGEGLGERNKYFGHVRYLNQQFIHIPYMIYWPGITRQQIQKPVSLLSVAPTLLDYLGITTNEPGFRYNESLVPGITRGEWPTKQIYSFAFAPSAEKNKLSIIKWPYQAIFFRESAAAPRVEFYNLGLFQSFRQMDQLTADVLVRYATKDFLFFQQGNSQLKSVFDVLTTGKPATKQTVLEQDKKEKLRSLGYLN